MTLETTEELLAGLTEQVALKARLKEYEFVIANLIQQMGGEVEVPVLKFEGLTGELIGEMPTITAKLNSEAETFTLSIDQRFPVPAQNPVIPTVQSYHYSDDPEMTFEGAVIFLRYVAADYEKIYGPDSQDRHSLLQVIDLITSDACLMKKKAKEPMFVLLGRDFAAPHGIISWLACRRESRIPTEWAKKEHALRICSEMMHYAGRIMPPA